MSSRKRHVRERSQRLEDSPVVWFCVLEGARTMNDTVLANRAYRQLRRLGITVTHDRPGSQQPEAADAR